MLVNDCLSTKSPDLQPEPLNLTGMDPKASIFLPAWSHLQTESSEITHLCYQLQIWEHMDPDPGVISVTWVSTVS